MLSSRTSLGFIIYSCTSSSKSVTCYYDNFSSLFAFVILLLSHLTS